MVRAMERHFNALLLDRSQKQFQLSREGMRVYDAAKKYCSNTRNC